MPDAIESTDSSDSIVFYDDARARTFEPFALSRPLCEMRVGAVLMRERWELALGKTSGGFVGSAHLSQFVEAAAPPACRELTRGTVLVNARAAIALTSRPKVPAILSIGGKIAALTLPESVQLSSLDNGTLSLKALAERLGMSDEAVEVEGVWLDEIWDVIRHLTPLLLADIPVIAKGRTFANVSSNNSGPIVTGRHALYVEDAATVEPFTYFDTTAGPVLIRSGSTVQAFTRVIGPCYIGHDCVVTTDRIAGSAIGDTSRVHGELSATVFIGQSNKGHDGFVGHSIVGRWVNMGAGTITSNLKNTYGTVALWTPSGVRDTGLQFLGTLFGDHVKTGIGLQLTTGCVLGTAANVFNTMPPKVVEPFAWGSTPPYDSYDANKFLDTAARMMSRRHVELTDAGRAYLLAVHAARWHTK